MNVAQALLSNQLLVNQDNVARQIIEFIVRMASIPGHSQEGLRIRQAAESIFQLCSSASASTRTFLWPVLLSFLAAPAYHQAAGCVAKALEMIAVRQIQETHPLELPPNPSQSVLFVRCLLFLSNPRETEPGALLSFLQYLAKSVHAELDAIFRVVLPKLDEYLSKHLHSQEWDQIEWHDLLLKLVIRSLSVLDSGSFLSRVRAEISASINCPQSVRCRPFMLQCSAAALAATPEKKFILNGIDQLLNITIHENPAERVACANAIDLLAASKHGDVVCDRFLATCRGKINTNESQMMKVLFGSAVTEKEYFKCTAFLALKGIFNNMVLADNYKEYLKSMQFLVQMSQHSELITWKAYFEAIASCSRASTKSGLEFLGRNEILTLLCREVLSHENYVSLHPLVIDTLSTMILSKPNLNQSEGGEIIRFGLSISASNHFPSGYLASLTALFKSCLTLEPSQSNLFNLLMTVYNWMTSPSMVNRQAATHIWLALITAYFDLRKEGGEEFTFLNELLCPMSIRAVDSDLIVRRTALECIGLIFELRRGVKTKVDMEIKEKMLSTEIETLYDGAAHFGEILSNFIEFGFSFIMSMIGKLVQLISEYD